MENIKIRKFKQEDLKQASVLVSNTFAKFNSKEGTKKGVQWYVNLFNPKKNSLERIKKMFSFTKISFVATDKNKIIGLIRGNKDRIINMYIDGKYHRKGIAKSLFEKFEKECKKQKSKEIKVKASIYAISFYSKIGFKKTTGIRNFHGLKIQPMKKVLKIK